MDNVTIHTNAAASKVLDNGDKVSGIEFTDRTSNETHTVSADGIFVQIGLVPNSAPFAELIETNKFGEIVIDGHCRTGVKGVYAAGDITTVPYKQIIIAMGEGAKAGLSVFEDYARGNLEALSSQEEQQGG
jgi:alkyl hydroperoxide reductase subunit F